MDVLRGEWRIVLKQAEDAKERGDAKAARLFVRNFQRRLCSVRVLDPACGTGNFLYVALELMKKLEGDVLETLATLGSNEGWGWTTRLCGHASFWGSRKTRARLQSPNW